MPKHAAKAFQNSAWHAPKPFKFEARGGLGSQKIAFDQPSDAQEPPEKRPRGFQSRPNAAKSQPRDIQEASKTAPDPSQVVPGTLQDEF